MISRFAKLTGLIAPIFLSGCVSLLPETAPPKPRYHISAASFSDSSAPAVDWSLVVEDPRTTRVYDSVKIAVSPSPGKIQYYAKAEWADRAARLFQTALVQSFEDTGRILSVGDRTSVPLADYVLHTDIRSLELDVRGDSETPRIAVYAKLTDGKGSIHAAQLFNGEQTAASADVDAVLSAFDSMIAEVLGEIVQWSFEAGEAENRNTLAGA